MSKPLTQADWDEICDYLTTHPCCYRISRNDDGMMMVMVDQDGYFTGGMHPRTFLDLIREGKP